MFSSGTELFIGFESKEKALAYRELHGGRVFSSYDEKPIIWFSPSFTMSEVIRHPSHRGTSGSIC